jgi:hypothetical protein
VGHCGCALADEMEGEVCFVTIGVWSQELGAYVRVWVCDRGRGMRLIVVFELCCGA